ncbi:hypothetical protein H072_5801 [Dactylellina haptotyla CBS 200.50]|uniref:Uncharacterized protein n=1 Tax=Dactylellina haptotyla (strain CBS 200.50) TaxID=1284197 RepID=S8BLS4_DACHA|nr:hypothetical protein H072_5801 [Dactylellina haptotyla CBS 200.50]
MTIFVQIRPPTIAPSSNPNVQPCGTDRVCYVGGTNFTTGMCGTWLDKENYCCTVADLGKAGAPTTNTCGSITGIHDSNFTTFGTLAISAPTCPNKAEAVTNKIGNDNEQCCPYDDYNELDRDIAAVYFYEGIGEGELSSNLTGIRCLNLTTQGMSADDSGSSYSGTKTGNSNSGSGSGSGSGSSKPNGVGLLNVPNCILGGMFVLMAIAGQLQF